MATPFGEDYEQFSRSDLTESDCFLSNCLIAGSTLATISVAGILVGVIAKFNPFCSSETSVSLKDLEDRSITIYILVNTRCIGRRKRAVFS